MLTSFPFIYSKALSQRPHFQYANKRFGSLIWMNFVTKTSKFLAFFCFLKNKIIVALKMHVDIS